MNLKASNRSGLSKLFSYICTLLFALSFVCLGAVSLFGLTSCSPAPTGEGEEAGYYFDSAATENGDGTKESPFRSLDAMSGISLQEGENIYLKSGSVFTGSLRLMNLTGTPEKPIYVTSYGEGERPKIDGSDCKGSGVVYMQNCAYIVVENLEIYDSATYEGDRRGVLMDVTNPSKTGETIPYRGITLNNLYIHDIRGILDAENNGMSDASKMTGGIQFWTTDGYGKFEDLTITGCVIENVDNVGISSAKKKGSSNPYNADFKNYAFTNVKITHNEIFNIGKNAIFMRNVYNGLIEHNVVHDTAVRCFTGNQIVTRSVDTVLVQFNEGYRNMAVKSPISDLHIMDGSMLDADLLSRNTIWQYNYSHDNSFGLFINCTGESINDKNAQDTAIVRYNLSVNDRGNKGIIYINYYSAGIEVYNNTIITSKDDSPVIFQANDNRMFNFYNNLIYNSSASASFNLGNFTNGALSNNLVFSAEGASIGNLDSFKKSNTDGVYLDPLIKGNVGSSLELRTGTAARQVCNLNAGSPAYGAAIEIDDVLTDMFGNHYRNVVGCAFQ